MAAIIYTAFPLPEYRTMLDNALIDLIEHDKPYNVEFKMRRLSDGRIIDIQSLAEYDPKIELCLVSFRTSQNALDRQKHCAIGRKVSHII